MDFIIDMDNIAAGNHRRSARVYDQGYGSERRFLVCATIYDRPYLEVECTTRGAALNWAAQFVAEGKERILAGSRVRWSDALEEARS